MLHNLWTDRSGAYLPIFALAAGVLILAGGFGIDYARALNDRSKAQAVADAMVLAMAQELRLGSSVDVARKTGRAIYDARYGSGGEAVTIDIQRLDDFRAFEISASFPGITATTFMRLARQHEMPWQVETSARVGMERLELALVTDVSYSMLEKDKIGEVKESLKQLVQAVFPPGASRDGRVISIIPYSDTVHMGSSHNGWLRSSQLMSFRNKYGQDPECIRPEPIEDRIVNDMSNLGSLVPFTQSYMNLSEGTFPFCPPSGSQILFFENDLQRLIPYIDGLETGFGTGTDIGLSWGWRALSPVWRPALQGRSRARGYPQDFGATNLKIVVVLTDGLTIRYDPAGDGVLTRSRLDGKDWEPSGDSRYIHASNHLKRTCDAIRKEGEIKLFTIGYDMETPGSEAQEKARQVLRECPANGGRYYETEYGQLLNTIRAIIAEFNIVRLRE